MLTALRSEAATKDFVLNTCFFKVKNLLFADTPTARKKVFPQAAAGCGHPPFTRGGQLPVPPLMLG
jgi:hypothetical protein